MRRTAAMTLAIALSSSIGACGDAQRSKDGERRAAQSVACGVHRVLSELDSVQTSAAAHELEATRLDRDLGRLEGRAARLEHDVRDLPDATAGRAALLAAAQRTGLAARVLLRGRSLAARADVETAREQLAEAAIALADSAPDRVDACTWSRSPLGAL